MDEPDLHVVPVMSCTEAKAFEKDFFARRETMSEETAMAAAGTGVGEAILRESVARRIAISRQLVFAGKGHNGGDAVRAAERIFEETSCATVLVFFAENAEKLAPLTRKFLEQFFVRVPAEKRSVFFLPDCAGEISCDLKNFAAQANVFIDGVFGHSFRPPFPQNIRVRLDEILSARSCDSICCSVDLPSGLCDAGASDCALRADFTFPTGILKTPVLAHAEFSGRVVPVSIAFSGYNASATAVADNAYFLKKIFAARPAVCDKRDFGHVLIVGGSRTMPGALMLNVLSALRASAGLVSVICPERVQAAFAARAPGAMWIPCRENAGGGLDCAAAFAEFEKILPRVSAVLCGSGMGVSADAQRLIQKIAAGTPREIPLVLDADALRPETLRAVRERGASAEKTVILPHAGEFARLGGKADCVREFCREHGLTLVLKGVCTRVADAQNERLAFAGTPVLARGGSGDVLAGMVAAMLASRKNFADEKAPVRERVLAAVIWHGNAARKLAAAQGERCADISALPAFFGE